MLKSEDHLLFSWHELARKKMLQISEERKKKSTWGRAWLQQMVWDWRGQSKRMQGCHCERKRKRKRKRSYKKRELVWFVGSVVCKKDSHSLGNILSFAKWIGQRERERKRLLSFFLVCTMQSLAIHYNRTRGTCYGLAQPY